VTEIGISTATKSIPRPQMETEREWNSDRPGVLFVTDQVFLPEQNGSSQTYVNVARQYASAGWRIHCLSFYRNKEQVSTTQTQSAYGELFNHYMLVPGWDLGGGPLGKFGMALRELNRLVTGNVFASHPFLVSSQKDFRHGLSEFIARERISEIYFHKPHSMLLLQSGLAVLKPARFVINLHDDFVARTSHYDAAYDSLFANLPLRVIARQHLAMYLRHRLSRAHAAASRRTELELLAQCEEIFIFSKSEFDFYAKLPRLRDRVRFQPLECQHLPAMSPTGQAPRYDAGFIGADSVMNLDAVIHLRDDILPIVREKIPDFRMLIAGTIARKVAPLVAGVANFEVWSHLAKIDDFYSAIGLAAIPLRHGTGVSVKAVEALHFGCPVVSTPIGVRGISRSTLSRHNVDITSDPAVFGTTLVQRALVRRATSREDR